VTTEPTGTVEQEQATEAVEPSQEDQPEHHAGFPLWGAVAIVVALVMMGLIAVALDKASRGRPNVGDEAPDFTLQILDGEPLTLSELRGKAVLINFWASWCDPCKDEAPGLEMLWRAYQEDDVVFIGIDWSDSELKARAYLEEFDITYPNGRDMGEYIADEYKLSGVPETYLIDQDGIVRWRYIGPIDDFLDLSDRIERLLGS
jgi:cytochrome c biogenesis protein CcmG/thiol:disulfide interchange protein DsbE